MQPATLWDGFKQWANAPFASDMDALHWFYFWGLLIVVAAMWGFILRHIYSGVSEG